MMDVRLDISLNHSYVVVGSAEANEGSKTTVSTVDLFADHPGASLPLFKLYVVPGREGLSMS